MVAILTAFLDATLSLIHYPPGRCALSLSTYLGGCKRAKFIRTKNRVRVYSMGLKIMDVDLELDTEDVNELKRLNKLLYT